MTTPAEPAPESEPDGAPLVRPGGTVDPDVVRALAAGEEGEDEGLRRVAFKLSRDLNKRLDRYLTDRIPFMSRTQLQRLIDLGGVTVNGGTPKCSTRLRRGDEVVVVVPPPPSKEIVGEEIPIDVLYEDAQILVLNKSPDLIVHPARSHNKGTLLNALVWYFEHASTRGGSLSGVGEEFARPGVVHRLDRRTSGVMVVAKDDEAHWKLGRQFELRKVDKRYLAVVEGVIEADADVIDVPIGPFPSRVKGMREKMAVRHDEWGKPAVTLCRVRERFEGHTLVELELKTGRTHQIRVHLSHLGYPIVADDMYGGRPPAPDADGRRVIERQALHAAVLGFRHPTTLEPVEFTAPLPPDMAGLVAALRARGGGAGPLTPPGATIDLERAVPGV